MTVSIFGLDIVGVGDWLKHEVGLPHLASSFAKNGIDGQMLNELDDGVLREDLGVGAKIQRRKILLVIEQARSELGKNFEEDIRALPPLTRVLPPAL
jgi:hypothetical protein